MKAIRIFKPKSLHIIDIGKPFLAEESSVLVRVTAAGICGSDMGIYHGINVAATYPRIIGHEIAGVVEEIVSSVTSLRPDNHVIVNQITSCGHCYPCRMGRENACGNLAIRDVHIDGEYQEYIAMPQEGCYLFPDSISDTGTVMIEPATITIQSCARVGLRKDNILLIYGHGVLGGSILRIAWLLYDYIIVTDAIGEKLEGAKSAEAVHTINVLKEDLKERIKEYTHGHGATVSIDTVCGNDSLIRPLKAVDDAGRVITMDLSTSPTEINQFLITSKELDIRGSHLQNEMFDRAIELINEGKLDLIGSVSHTFPLSKTQEAFDFIDLHDPSIRKVVPTSDSQQYTE